MKHAVVYLLNNAYLTYFHISLNSLLHNNVKNNFDIVLFYDTVQTFENLKQITKTYNCTFIFKQINKNNYKNNRNYNPYYRLEIFTLEEYDKILYLDCDTIICKEIDELFLEEIEFGAVKYFFFTEFYLKNYNLKNYFNAGIMIIGKKYLNAIIYNNFLLKLNSEKSLIDPSLCKFDQTSENEEPFLNYCLGEANTPIPSIFNASIYTSEFKDIKDIKIIHLQGISKFLYNLQTLIINKKKKNFYLLKRFSEDKRININFNIIIKIFFKIKRYILEEKSILIQILKKLYK